MTLVHVNLADRSYDIHIGAAVPIGAALAGEAGLRALLVSDSNVAPLHAEGIANRLRERGLEVQTAVVRAGEASKTLDQMAVLLARAAEAGLERSSVIVAVGGGMIGDLAGLVAATYLRGIRLIQVPTTLLAMVDSSVGGKTAVNLPQGKNLVGAFHQPIEVVADLDTLATLPEREYVSGLAEAVKYGVIWDAALFRVIETHAAELLKREPGVLARVIARCCEIKGEIVAMDEREDGVRAILNFGHTLGHAVEKTSGYGHLLHGEAVALGMAYAGRLSVAAKGFPGEDCDRLTGLLVRLGLPVRLDGGQVPSWEALREAMAADKKTRRRVPRWVLAERLGAVVYGCEVAEETLRAEWAALEGLAGAQPGPT